MRTGQIKTDVFSMLMENKENALEVYNALNDSNYSDAEQIDVITLEKGVSILYKGDTSFIVDMDLNIYEHQTSYCANRPLRSLIYWTDLINSLMQDQDILSQKKILLPTPKFVVFYNGLERRPPIEILKLSDSFEKHVENPELELTCYVYNLNPGHDIGLLKKSKVLYEFTTFIEQVRFYQGLNYEYPIDAAINWCIAHEILVDFLEAKGTQILQAMTLNISLEKREYLIRRDERAEGLLEGFKNGRCAGIAEEKRDASIRVYLNCLNHGLSKEEAIIISQISPEDLKNIDIQVV